MESESPATEIERPAEPTFLANGFPRGGVLPTNNPLIHAEMPLPDIQEDEKEAVLGLRRRTLSADEIEKVQIYLARRKDKAEETYKEWQTEIHRQAFELSEQEKKIKRREQAIVKQERTMAIKDKELRELQLVLDGRDKILAEMPAEMDEKSTRKWHLDQRRFTLSMYRSLAENSTNENTRMKALERLSNEDRGQHGKGLREDEDAGPGVIVLEKGAYGIPE